MRNLCSHSISLLVRSFLITLFIVGVPLLGANKLLTATNNRIECPNERCPKVSRLNVQGSPDQSLVPRFMKNLVRDKKVTNNQLSSALLDTVDYQDKSDSRKIMEY